MQKPMALIGETRMYILSKLVLVPPMPRQIYGEVVAKVAVEVEGVDL